MMVLKNLAEIYIFQNNIIEAKKILQSSHALCEQICSNEAYKKFTV
jgi:hypothetical protein